MDRRSFVASAIAFAALPALPAPAIEALPLTPRQEHIAWILRMICPENVARAVGVVGRMAPPGSPNVVECRKFTTEELARCEMAMERSVDAAVRNVSPPQGISRQEAGARDWAAKFYFDDLVAYRDRWAADEWARISKSA